jgi:acyl-[acyl-carrier-protein]-phospholipid O-acyltransferase/long-chain-fatty-acid--[acyl-carrier-protein] ligase
MPFAADCRLPISHCLLGYITESGLEWADLGLLGTAFVAYLLLAFAWPAALLKPLWWLATHTIYRMRVHGRQHVPASGPVLLVCNHVSYVDWMLIWAACPRRVRFVAWAGWKKNPLLRLFLRVTRSIAIDGNAGPKAIVAALRKITEALDNGETICLFPEARLTRTGLMLPFHRGFERVLKQAKKPVAVIPVCISQLWGSIFSYRGGRVIWKFPERLPYPVSVMFGEALPQTVRAPEARQRIQELSAETAVRDSDRSRPVHRHFVRVASSLRQLFRPCFIDTTAATPRTLSYAKALVGSMVISRWLKGQIGGEKNVGVWLPSSVGSALTNIALAFLGRTSVNLNYTTGNDSLRSAVQQTGMKTVITSKRFLSRMPLELGPEIKLVMLEEAAGAIGKWQRIRTFLAVLLLPGWMIDRWLLGLGVHSLDDIATIIFSSGSTGEPKGVMLSHRNIAANAESTVAHIGVDHHDRILGVLPFFHSFGYTVTFWMPLAMGGSVVYYPDPRQAKEIGELSRIHRCTIFLATATFMRFYLRRCAPDDFKTLRLLVCGAEKLPPALAKDFEAKFGILPLEGYGITELSPVISANITDQEIDGTRYICNKLGTVGHPIPGVAARILDADLSQPQPIGQEGMIFIKGANVMAGYLNKPELTAKVIVDGWYNTGDMGRLDDDGFITITGRLSRFAKIGGEMVPLEKVEEDLHAVLGTTDRLLAVTALPDEKKGERLIVLHLDTLTMPIPELTTKLGERGLPNLWVPGDRDFYLVPELPVLGSGKLDLRRVKELAIEKTASKR